MKKICKMLQITGYFQIVIVLLLCNSCNNNNYDVIEGELTLLVEDDYDSPHSPRWSPDGSGFYYILGNGDSEPEGRGPLFYYQFENSTKTQITAQDVRDFDISPTDSVAVTWEAYWFWIRNSDSWNVVDSFKPCEKAMDYWLTVSQPKFSYQSEGVLFYTYTSAHSDTVFMQQINLIDSTDKEILRIQGSNQVFAPGSGDSLVALNDTIYNLHSRNQIPIGITPKTLHWNPSNPNQLLICTGDYQDMSLYLFDVETMQIKELNTETPGNNVNVGARFSPDGKYVIFVTSLGGDANYRNQIWLFEPVY